MGILTVIYIFYLVVAGMANYLPPASYNFAGDTSTDPVLFTARQARGIQRHSGGEGGSRVDHRPKRRWSASLPPIDWESTRISRYEGPGTKNDWDQLCTPGGVAAKAILLAGKLTLGTTPLNWSPVRTQGERISDILAVDYYQRNPTFPVRDYAEVHRKSMAGMDHYRDTDSGNTEESDYSNGGYDTTDLTPVSQAYVADTVDYSWAGPMHNYLRGQDNVNATTGLIVSTMGLPSGTVSQQAPVVVGSRYQQCHRWFQQCM